MSQSTERATFIKETCCLGRSCLEEVGHRQKQTKEINGKNGWQMELCVK